MLMIAIIAYGTLILCSDNNIALLSKHWRNVVGSSIANPSQYKYSYVGIEAEIYRF